MITAEEIKELRKTLNLTQRELGSKIGVSINTIGNYEKGGVIPASKQDLLEKMINEAKHGTKVRSNISDIRLLEDISFYNIPLVPIHAQAGYARGYGDQEYIDELPTFPVIVDKNYRGKYRVFEVEGDSMDDGSRNALYDGDKVLCREVKKDLWTSKLHFHDWYFVLVLKTDGVTVKQITDHNLDAGNVTCHPLNPIFDDFTINLNDVAELYNVIKIVERNTRI